MTKKQAAEIKKIVKSECGNYTVYFDSKKGELRFTIVQYYDGSTRDNDAVEKDAILEILGALTRNGLRPKYRRDSRRYQGFINCRYIIFQ